MSIYKRGGVYWYHFTFNGEHIQESTKQGNPRVARQMEAAHRTSLAKGEVGIRERKPVPSLKDFSQRFIDAIQARCAAKPLTGEFYASKLARLLEFAPLASAKLDSIDESLIESYVQHRRVHVAPASINRELATLRRALRLAQDWHLIDRVPRIRLLPGERMREFVLSDELEQAYLSRAPQLLADVALLILDTGMRPAEVLALEWPDVHFDPAKGAKLGYIHVRKGKTRNAKRNLSLTTRARAMLSRREQGPRITDWVFTDGTGKSPLSRFTLRDQHDEVRKAMKIAGEFVIYSLRHTFGTRLGESGADAFTIMRIMGHSTVTVSQRYVHPTPETLERAFERLQERNQRAAERLQEQAKPAKLHAQRAVRQLPATLPATVEVREVDGATQAA